MGSNHPNGEDSIREVSMHDLVNEKFIVLFWWKRIYAFVIVNNGARGGKIQFIKHEMKFVSIMDLNFSTTKKKKYRWAMEKKKPSG